MRIEHGDCLDVMARLIEEGVVVDSIITDPPYHLVSVVKRFANARPETEKYAATSKSAYMSRGFMGKKWDGGDIAFRSEVWKLALQILKPGGHMLVFGGTRTYHRMACAVEDAGFEIRDQVGWVFGSGFPKSHDVSKGIDRAAGAARKTIGTRTDGRGASPQKIDNHGPGDTGIGHADGSKQTYLETAPTTEAARQWDGWGTALKPAWEPIVLARKPLSEKTIAANVLTHGTGALNVDGCRVGLTNGETPYNYPNGAGGSDPNHMWRGRPKGDGEKPQQGNTKGRWPANVIHDGSPEVMEAFPDTGKSTGGRIANISKTSTIYGGGKGLGQNLSPDDVRGDPGFGDTGTAARFFYTAKADKKDRLQSKHPTVKPVDLIAYLCRLITPPKGLVLDPFAGSGTTGMACMREGFRCILIEKEDEYVADIRHRLKHVKGKDAPLFAGVE